MKFTRLIVTCALLLAIAFVPAQAGVFRHLIKPAAQGGSYPFRHPKKTLKNSAKASAHAVKKVAY